MPIKATYTLKCSRCGKEFAIKIGDAITPQDKIKLDNPICNFCKFKLLIKLKK